MPDASATGVYRHWSREELETLVEAVLAFDAATRERGRRYSAEGHVGPLTIGPGHVFAPVYGTERYAVHWEQVDLEWIPSCTCPSGPRCKHAFALACAILIYARDAGLEAPGMDLVLEERPQPTGRHNGDGSPEISARDRQALAKVRSSRHVWEREYAFGQLIAESPNRRLSVYLPPFPEILEEPDPDVRCMKLAQAVAERAQGWVPPALLDYVQREDLHERIAARARDHLRESLSEWLREVRQPPARSVRAVLWLETDFTGRVTVHGEGRVTSPRLHDARRSPSQLQQMLSDARARPGMLPPEQVRLLEWLVESEPGFAAETAVSMRRLRSLLLWFPESPLIRWADDLDPDLARRGGIEPGSVVRCCAAPVRLAPDAVTRGDDVLLELRLLWEDGRRRSLDEVVLAEPLTAWSRREASLVVCDGEVSFVVQQPPGHLIDQFREAGGLPVHPREDDEIIADLADTFEHVEQTVQSHTREYPVRPGIALDLRGDDWLQMRVFAISDAPAWRPGDPVPEGSRLFEYDKDRRWKPVRQSEEESGAIVYEAIDEEALDSARTGEVDEEATTDERELAPEETWREIPRRSDVRPAMDWVESTGASRGDRRGPGGTQPPWPDHDVGWWLNVGRRRMDEFMAAWERRPERVAYFGNARLRRLLRAEDRLAPVVRVEPSGVDWFSISAGWRAEGLSLTEDEIARLRAASTRYVRLESGWVDREAVLENEPVLEALADLGIEVGEEPQRIGLWQLAGARPDTLRDLEELGTDAATREALEQLREEVESFAGLPELPLPAGLRAELRPYQRRGLDFLAYTTRLGLGPILADDMGLGKTVQALAWIQHLRENDPEGGPTLVVCPASVMHNWEREAERFTPDLRVLTFASGTERHALREQIPDHDLLITNYALLRRDIEQWREVDLRAAILDEAQNIKNPDAVVSRATRKLNARHRLALTGTPLENRALDLWSIMQFLNPGYLGSRSRFTARFDRTDSAPHRRTLLAARLRPVLLRRTKAEVARDLPPRIEERLDCDLTAGQRRLYLAELRRSRALVQELAENEDGIERNRVQILAALTRLRQICAHPALAGGKASLGSGKFDALFELIEPVLAEGHKVLVFSQFVQCLKRLGRDLQRRDIPYYMLTGQTRRRGELVDSFQEDERACVFLVSLKAGGTGLNLTAASYVVLFDPWWNPAVEAQAIDRTHRIGQTRTVIAYRMLTTGTIEEKIWELQQRKAEMVRDILGESGFARALSRDDLSYLFESPED